MDGIKIMGPGETANFGSEDHLTQVQHKGDRVEIVDHLHKDPQLAGSDLHVVTTVDKNGKIDSDW